MKGDGLKRGLGRAADLVEDFIAWIFSLFFGKNGKFKYRKEIKAVANLIKAGLIIGALLIVIPPHLLLQPLAQGMIGRAFNLSSGGSTLVTYALAIIVLLLLAKDKLKHGFKYLKKQSKKIFG